MGIRINVGIAPELLTDQHLIAEYREIGWLEASIRKKNFCIKSPVPDEFNFGIGHLNFIMCRLTYAYRRHEALKREMSCRGFNGQMTINLNGVPDHCLLDWYPTLKDSMIVRNRVISRMQLKGDTFWRQKKKVLSKMELNYLIRRIAFSPLCILLD